MRLALILMLAAACGGPVTTSPTLKLQGPLEVTVDALGPIDGPTAVLSDGTMPDGLTVTASPTGVVAVGADGVRAVGAGEAEVTVAWEGQSATYKVLVQPAVRLVLSDPPGGPRVKVGGRAVMHLQARVGTDNVDPGRVTWASSDAAVATVSQAGEVAGVATGVVWVTVTDERGQQAMIELQVVE